MISRLTRPVFTTIQKFMPEEKGGKAPELSKRRNIIVIADEAHRSQYDLIDGLARNLRDSLPNASFMGFTGTPIEKTDANTRAVFGDYVSILSDQFLAEVRGLKYKNVAAEIVEDLEVRSNSSPQLHLGVHRRRGHAVAEKEVKRETKLSNPIPLSFGRRSARDPFSSRSHPGPTLGPVCPQSR